jgi:hypothetical protein
VKNWQNRHYLLINKEKEDKSMALIDLEAAELSLPNEMIYRLKLESLGNRAKYIQPIVGNMNIEIFGIAEIEVQGRVSHIRAIKLLHGARTIPWCSSS